MIRIPDFTVAHVIDASNSAKIDAIAPVYMESLRNGTPIQINEKEWRGDAFVIRMAPYGDIDGKRELRVTFRPTGAPR